MCLAGGTFEDVKDGPWQILTDYIVNLFPYPNQESGAPLLGGRVRGELCGMPSTFLSLSRMSTYDADGLPFLFKYVALLSFYMTHCNRRLFY